MKVITAPEELVVKGNFSVFLAESIKEDTYQKWQDIVIDNLSSSKGIILNPRREAWDAS